MIYVQLFFEFLKTGAVSFGGGYGMISLIRETVLKHHWLTDGEFMAFVAVSESTPGPLAVNMATFVGASQGGIMGAFLSTIGVTLPAFLLMLLIASCMKNLLKYAGVKVFLSAVRPCIAALVLATAVIMGLQVFCGIKRMADPPEMRVDSILIFLILAVAGIIAKKTGRKPLSPIGMILVSAGLGILFHCVPV